MPQTRLDEVAAWAGDLPTLSPVAARVLQLTQWRLTDTSVLEQEILRDQALATQVLRLANSCAYAMRGMVATVSRGIFLLGFATVRSMVIATCTESVYRHPHSGFKDQILWEHALGTAAISRLIAAECDYPAGEEAFIAGLLHDVGKVVMDAKLRERYKTIIANVSNAEADSFVEAERAMFGVDHAEVGFLVVRSWGLPPAIVESVRYHHDPASAIADPQLCAIVSLANALCVKLELGPHQRPDLDLAALPACEQLGLTTGGLNRLMARAAACAAAELEPYASVWRRRDDDHAA